jgi:hypothetical protein
VARRRSPVEPCLTGIDLSYRPRSYFWPLSVATHLLAQIKGAERRAALQRLLDEDRLSEVPDLLARSALSESEREAMARIHPAFMGGEYLPDLADKEVEIARITIASTTQDVTSVFARRQKNRICYRIVDEYGGETLSGRWKRTSTQPLTLRQLESFFNAGWSIFDVLATNFDLDATRADEMQRFVVGIDSAFYPNFGLLYRRRIQAWAHSGQYPSDYKTETL